MIQSKILEYIDNYNLENEQNRAERAADFYQVDDTYEIASIHSLATVDESFRFGKKTAENIEDFINKTFSKFKKDNPRANSEAKKYPYYDFSKTCLDIVCIKYFRIKNGIKEKDPMWRIMYLFGKDAQGNDLYFYSNSYVWKDVIPNLFRPRKALETLPTQIVDYLKTNGILDKVAIPAKDVSPAFLAYIDFYNQEIVHDNMYDNRFVNYLNANDLNSISEDNPWKKFEGLSIENFIVENFKSIKEEAPIFTDVISKLVIEIRFIQIFNTKLNRNYWFCIYLLGDDDEGNPKYMIGGEPERDTPTSDNLKENDWNEFPEDIRKFWSIHGIFETDLYGDIYDCFNLKYLEQLYTEHQEPGNLPHHTSLTFVAEKLGNAVDWDPEEICLDMDHPNNYNENVKSWEDEKEYETFVKDYLKKAIVFSPKSFIVKPYKGLPQYFQMYNSCPSFFYPSFWEMLTLNIKTQSFGLSLEIENSSETTLQLLQEKINKKGTKLDLEASNLKRIPKEITHFKNLKEINFSANNITEVPNFLAELPNLKKINLFRNKLTEFPKVLYQLKKLKYINLGKNQIKETPKELHQLPKLKELNLEANQIEIVDFGNKNKPSLKILKLGSNKIHKIVSDFSFLPNVFDIHIDRNPLTIENIHPSVFKLPELRYFFINMKGISWLKMYSYFESDMILGSNIDYSNATMFDEDLDTAIEIQHKRIRLYPNGSECVSIGDFHTKLAEFYGKKGDVKNQEKHLKIAVGLADHKAIVEYANYLRNNKFYVKSNSYYKKALELYKGDKSTIKQIKIVLAKNYNALAKELKNNSTSFISKLFKSKEDALLDLYLQAFSYDKKNVITTYYLTRIYLFEKEDIQNALKYALVFLKYEKSEEDYLEIKEYVVSCYFGIDDYENALKHIDYCIAHSENKEKYSKGKAVALNLLKNK